MITDVTNKLKTKYWLNELKDLTTIMSDKRLTTNVIESKVIASDALKYFLKLTSGNHIGEYTVLLTIYHILIQRFFTEPSIILSKGVKSDNNNAVLYRFTSLEKKTLKSFLQLIKGRVQNAYENIDYETLIINEKVFELYTYYAFRYNCNDGFSESVPFQLSICKNQQNDLELSLSYHPEYCHQSLAVQFINTFSNWVQQIETHLETFVGEILLLDEKEVDEVFQLSTNPICIEQTVLEQTISDLFEIQVMKTPDNMAVICNDSYFTYREFNELANQFANYLRDGLNIDTGDFIGVKLERSEFLPVVLMGVLKSGACYVPLDIKYPQKRIAYIEKDSNCKLIIDNTVWESFRKEKSNFAKENLPKYTTSIDLAYIIYTSGTTGNPKGVMITHQNAVAFINWAQQEFSTSDYQIVHAGTSHCFDLSIFEMFYTLSVGKPLRILDNPLATKEYLEIDQKILINTVPSVMRSLLDEHCDFSNVSTINLAGEVFPPEIANKLCEKDIEVRNLYGPSEDTTYSTCYQLSKSNYSAVPIGKPISRTRAYVLDENFELLPVGVVGKLFVSGAGVAAGYLGRTDLTMQRFINDPFVPGDFMYDTGDLVKWRSDGELEFLGRKDNQVKIRGYRIELGEIEQAILECYPNVSEVVVDIREENEQEHLVAYYVLKHGDLNFQELKSMLSDKLPAYMVPRYYIEVLAMPLTPNGKINRKELKVTTVLTNTTGAYVAPRNSLEKTLVTIWEEVLKVEKVGINDSFFDLGGHSLMISQIINRVYKKLGKTMPYKAFYENPTVGYMATQLEDKLFFHIPKAPVAFSYPLTPAQNRLWLLNQLTENTGAYNITGAISLTGDLDTGDFIKAFKHVFYKHEILRTYFKTDHNAEVRQFVLPKENFKFTIEVEDFSDQENPDLCIQTYIAKEEHTKFDLAKLPLFKTALLKRAKNEHVFFLNMHHCISDGWSLEVLTTEVISAYEQLQLGIDLPISDLPFQFKDYAIWQETNRLQKVSGNKSRTYWLRTFHGDLPVLELPSYQKRPLVKTYRGKQITKTFSKEIIDTLKHVAKSQDATLFMLLMASIRFLLSKYSNQQDIILGTPVAGREHQDLESQVGMYVNTLAIRNQLKEEDNFTELLEREKKNLVQAFEHSEYPFDTLIEELGLKRNTSRSPLFDVLVVLQNQKQLSDFESYKSMIDLRIDDYPVERTSAQFDLSFTFEEKEELILHLSYNTDIYNDNFIHQIFDHLDSLFQQLIISPTTLLSDIDLITNKEKEVLLDHFNNTKVVYGQQETLIELFKTQVAKTPDATALVIDQQKWSYKEIDNLSNTLANYISSQQEFISEDLIGIKQERTEWLIISILAVLKCGCAYVPLDPNYPVQRIDYIQKDSNCRLLIDQDLIQRFQNEVHVQTTYPDVLVHHNDLAYVIYTSGSTGKPKGVMISHGNAVEMIKWSQTEFADTDFEMLYAVTSHCFDLSVYEIFFPLSIGKTIRLLENGLCISDHLIHDQKVLINTVPSVITILIDRGIGFDNAVGINLAGEPFPVAIANHFYKSGIQLRNLYGPSEDTTYSTCFKVEQKYDSTVPIGKPIANTSMYILSDDEKLQPVGVIGELCISGAGVAKGYLNKPDLTDEKFLDNPFDRGSKMYKTGDLARWTPDGNIEFLGRKDHQVKMHGYRIELGEIETSILNFSEDIKQVVVDVKSYKEDQVLVAYYLGKEDVSKEDFVSYLQEHLPRYMIPQFFVKLDHIPLNPNGKIDKKALPEISNDFAIHTPYVPLVGRIENELANIWKQILKVDTIGALDDFFELGGHSLQMAQLINKINKTFLVQVSFEKIFNYSVLRTQVQLIKESLRIEYQSIQPIKEAEYYEMSYAQKSLWMAHQFKEKETAYNMPAVYRFEGELNIEILQSALRLLIAKHEILRTIFKENEEGQVKQFILPSETFEFYLSYDDFSFESNKEVYLERVVSEELSKPFDLASAPLLRAQLIQLGDTEYALVFVVHHIICDAWSFRVMIEEVCANYNNILQNQQIASIQPNIQYKDYSHWLVNQIDTRSIKGDYWLQELKGNITSVPLKYDFHPDTNTSFDGNNFNFSLDTELSKDLKKVSEAAHFSEFTFHLAAFFSFLSLQTGQSDLILGSPFAGRNHADLEDQIGYYVNLLPLRVKVDIGQNFQTLINQVQNKINKALEHQMYPMDFILKELNFERKEGGSSFINVGFTWNELNYDSLKINDDLYMAMQPIDTKVAKHDLWVISNGQHFIIEYREDLFYRETIELFAERYQAFLNELSKDHTKALSSYDYKTSTEKQIANSKLSIEINF